MAESNHGSALPGILAAFAAGALVGAGVALLYAPRSGKETRQLLCKKTRDLRAAAEQALEDGRDLADAAKDRTGEVIEQGQETAREIGRTATRSA